MVSSYFPLSCILSSSHRPVLKEDFTFIWACVYLGACACGVRRGHQVDHLELDLCVVGSWEPNVGPVEELQALLTAEPSEAPPFPSDVKGSPESHLSILVRLSSQMI